MAKPNKVWKIGLVECAEFENKIEGKDYTLKKYVFKRSYKDREDKWQSTTYMDYNDLVKVKTIISDIQRQSLKTTRPE